MGRHHARMPPTLYKVATLAMAWVLGSRVGLADDAEEFVASNDTVINVTDNGTVDNDIAAIEALADGAEIDVDNEGASVLGTGTGPYGLIPDSYEVEVPPVLVVGNTTPSRTTVLVGFQVNKLLNVNPGDGILSLSAWVKLFWYDPRLSFNGSEMFHNRKSSDPNSVELDQPWSSDGHSHVSVDPESIWKPDLVLREKVDSFVESCSEEPALLFDETFTIDRAESMGQTFNVYWGRACVLVTKCRLDLADFPFDVNRCKLTWQPWSETMYKVKAAPGVTGEDLVTQQFEVSLENVNGTLLSFTHNLPGGGTFGKYDAIQWTLVLERHPSFYLVNFIGPTVLIVLLAWLTFFVPLTMSDRISYSATLTLTAMAVALLTSEKRPADKGDMWIDWFQTSAFILVNIPIIETVFALRIGSMLESNGASQVNMHIVHLDRICRVLYIFLVIAWLLVMFLPSSPVKKGHDNFTVNSTIMILFVFWVPLVTCLTAISCWHMKDAFRDSEVKYFQTSLKSALLEQYRHEPRRGVKSSGLEDTEEGVSMESWSSGRE